jgi:dihydropteroate synthase type 2
MSPGRTLSPPARRPGIVGIVNVTDDSFSDGGVYRSTAAARAHAARLAADGVDVVELGAAASSPEASAVPPAEERRRLEPLLDDLLARDVVVSVDSVRPETQLWAARRGAALVNDIRGFPHPEVRAQLAETRATLVVMHAVEGGERATRIATDAEAVVEGLYRFFDRRLAELTAAGVGRERLIVDPGMGYFLGSNPEPSVRVLAEIPRLKATFGLPVLVSVSRKSFLGALTGRPVGERAAATLAAELHAAAQGVDWVRTHDVRALRDALAVLAALRGPS